MNDFQPKDSVEAYQFGPNGPYWKCRGTITRLTSHGAYVIGDTVDEDVEDVYFHEWFPFKGPRLWLQKSPT